MTLTGTVGRLYINGQVVAQNDNMTPRPPSLASTTQNWIGAIRD